MKYELRNTPTSDPFPFSVCEIGDNGMGEDIASFAKKADAEMFAMAKNTEAILKKMEKNRKLAGIYLPPGMDLKICMCCGEEYIGGKKTNLCERCEHDSHASAI